MLEFLIIAFRYFFVFYIIYFLWQAVCYILIERNRLNKDKNIPIIKQRITIAFIHIKSFFILSGGTNINIILYGALWLILFVLFTTFAKKIYKNSCPLIWNGMFFLTSIGSIILFRLNYSLAIMQLTWLFISCIVLSILPIGIQILPKLEKLQTVYLLVGISLLSSTFIVGTEEFGSLRFIRIGEFGFSPAELVSFTYILYLATAFRKKLTFKNLIFPSCMAAMHIAILSLQRNLGGALIFFVSYMVIMYISTGRVILFGIGITLFSIASTLAYHLFWHVQVRVAVWQNPWADVHGIGYQIIQSLFSIGTWGAFGIGLTRGIPNTVPVVTRDLTFAAVAEEFGIIFALGIICIYIMLFYRGVNVALRCKRRYYSLIAIGFTCVLTFQTILIIGGTINLIPLTGVTLPFISYGGTSLLTSVVMIGMVQWIFSYYENLEEYDVELQQ